MALDRCKSVFFLNIFRTNGCILIKFCICINKYKIHVVSNARYFWSTFKRVMIPVLVEIHASFRDSDSKNALYK